MDKVEELVEWNFSEPLTDEEEGYFSELFYDFRDIHALFLLDILCILNGKTN